MTGGSSPKLGGWLMKSLFRSVQMGLVGLAVVLHSPALAGKQVEATIEEWSPRPVSATSVETGFDFVAPVSFTGAADAGKIGIYSFSTSLRQTFQLRQGTGLILGGSYRQFWFPSSGGEGVIPENAGAIAATVGLRHEFAEKWNVVLLGSFGFYSSEWDASAADSWNFDLVGTVEYAFSDNLQAFVGVAVFPRFQIPVLPAVGVRWQINEEWTLNLAMPKPTIEYEFADNWRVYAFGQLAGGRFRTGSDFGSPDRPNLGNRWMSYLDLRTGGGVSWSPSPLVTLRAEVGSSVYREFEFDGAGFSVNAGAAIMAASSVSVRF